MSHCAIIGAGAAGLSAARTLRDAGIAVSLFDKGRRAGGRLASRTSDYGDFDHGAQFLRLRDVGLLEHARQWEQAAALSIWPEVGEAGKPTALIGTPTMNALAQHWASGLAVHCSHELQRIDGSPGRWTLQFADGVSSGPYTALIVTAPAPQALAWYGDTPMASALQRVEYAPCIALMWVPDSATLPALATLSPPAGSGIGFIAREDLKPGRGGVPRYQVHADADWSQQQIEQAPAVCGAELQRRAARLLGIGDGARYAQAHRWRYALVTQPIGQACLSDAARGWHYASDACLGGRVEAALLSGRAAAQAVIEAGAGR